MKSAALHSIAGVPLWVEQWKFSMDETRPCLIFLHEALGSAALWKDYPALLCERLQCNGLVYDRMGHGLSAPFTHPREKDYLEKEALIYLAALIEQFELQQPILVGHSDGGTIALLYAAHFSAQLTGIITEAAHIYVDPTGADGIRRAIEQFEHHHLKEKLAKYHGDKTEALFYAWADTWTAEAFSDWNIADQLPRISCPALILQGDGDQYAGTQHMWDIASGIGSNAQAVLVENCGHIPHLQAQAQTLQLSVDFIEGLMEV